MAPEKVLAGGLEHRAPIAAERTLVLDRTRVQHRPLEAVVNLVCVLFLMKHLALRAGFELVFSDHVFSKSILARERSPALGASDFDSWHDPPICSGLTLTILVPVFNVGHDLVAAVRAEVAVAAVELDSLLAPCRHEEVPHRLFGLGVHLSHMRPQLLPVLGGKGADMAFVALPLRLVLLEAMLGV